jgi:hypothetical protein
MLCSGLTIRQYVAMICEVCDVWLEGKMAVAEWRQLSSQKTVYRLQQVFGTDIVHAFEMAARTFIVTDF